MVLRTTTIDVGGGGVALEHLEGLPTAEDIGLVVSLPEGDVVASARALPPGGEEAPTRIALHPSSEVAGARLGAVAILAGVGQIAQVDPARVAATAPGAPSKGLRPPPPERWLRCQRRRREPRYDVVAAAQLVVPGHTPLLVTGETTNLSRGGARLRVDAPLSGIAARDEVLVAVSDRLDTAVCSARVVAVSGSHDHVSVAFHRVDDVTAMRLDGIITRAAARGAVQHGPG